MDRMKWQEIQPNAQYDWINQRSPEFAIFYLWETKKIRKKEAN